jgi:hypothetical protein
VSTLISSVAHFVPPTTVLNSDLASRLGITTDWIVRRTGIQERRIAESGGTSDLIVPAATECLHRAGISATDLNCVIVATITPDHLTPATAVTVIRRLGATNAWGFDLSAACSGFTCAVISAPTGPMWLRTIALILTTISTTTGVPTRTSTRTPGRWERGLRRPTHRESATRRMATQPLPPVMAGQITMAGRSMNPGPFVRMGRAPYSPIHDNQL